MLSLINGTKIRMFHFPSVKCLHTARTFYEVDILYRNSECWLVEGSLYHCFYKIFAHNTRNHFDAIQIECSHQNWRLCSGKKLKEYKIIVIYHRQFHYLCFYYIKNIQRTQSTCNCWIMRRIQPYNSFRVWVTRRFTTESVQYFPDQETRLNLFVVVVGV